ncbi:MAG: threonine--tRNA ligase, partial [Rhodospirillales bacterium]|nr:threonine--tRNA ligase [Rhodospirillales bacterium]
LLQTVYADFGFTDVVVKYSDRPEVRAGDDAVWDKAEGALQAAVEEAGLDYTLNPGEGAFYGPKLEFVLRDAIGRDWQCGTLQVDMNMPRRLEATYVDTNGDKQYPVMLHRALFGSLERFAGIMIEHYAGRLPLWLAPQKAVVATITSEAEDYGREVAAAFNAAGIACETDFRNEKINYKVREHSVAKVPVIAVLGAREAENRTVALRRLGGKEQEILALDDAVARLVEEAAGPLSTR